MKKRQRFLITFCVLLFVMLSGSLIAFAGDGNVRYTAVLVGNTYPDDAKNMLYAPATDAAKMQSALESLDVPYESNVKIMNASRAAVLKAISSKCSSAVYDDDDQFLFYYSGHGTRSNNQGNVNNGALVCCAESTGKETEALTLTDLAAALGRFPGKVAVILDSCGSGASVEPAESGLAVVQSTAVSESRGFLSDVIDAFRREEKASGTENEISKKNMELAANKFYVLASCKAGTISYEDEVVITSTQQKYYYSVMTYNLLDCMGYDYLKTKREYVFQGDSNKNNRLSLKECYDYVSPRVIKDTEDERTGAQEVVMYPSSGDPRCNDTLFSDANIDAAAITIPNDSSYTGAPCTPVPVVEVNFIKLTAGTDYDVTYANNTNAGTASLTVTGKNGYVGQRTVSFEISESKVPTISRKVKKLTAKVSGKKVRVSWLKDKKFLRKNPQVRGYEVQIASDKQFNNVIKAGYIGRNKTSFTFKGKKKSVWYVRIRYYDGNGYSNWTTSKKIRIR